MGYFSEMSLDMQEGRKPSAASLTRECAFEDGENFDELPVPPADRQPVPPAAEPGEPPISISTIISISPTSLIPVKSAVLKPAVLGATD